MEREREMLRHFAKMLIRYPILTGRLFTLLRAFPPQEPTKKRFVEEMITWSIKFGEYENGDPELHHVAGTLFAEGSLCSILPTSGHSSYS